MVNNSTSQNIYEFSAIDQSTNAVFTIFMQGLFYLQLFFRQACHVEGGVNGLPQSVYTNQETLVKRA